MGHARLLGAIAIAIAATVPVSAQTIDASPNPVVVPDGGVATTTIRWSSGARDAQVWVHRGSEPETLFAGGPSGSQAAPWIQQGDPYVFRLYSVDRGAKTFLGSVEVRGVGATMPPPPPPGPVGPGSLAAIPATVLIDANAALGATTIQWSATTDAVVTVSRAGDPTEHDFAGGMAGSASAPWIQRGDPYVFRLYEVRSGARALVATTSVRGLTRPRPGAGINAFDLALQYHGLSSGGRGGPGKARVQRAMARKRLDDARALGIGYLRTALAGYSAYDLATWRTDPQAYWAEVDDLFDDFESRGLSIVPSIVWNVSQFPEATGETVRDLIANPGSASRALLVRFITEFTTRYRGRRAIAFYEIGNELNLTADLDMVRRGAGTSWGNYTTDEMIAFTRDVAGAIRAVDPSRPITSGHSLPRTAAEHLRRTPEFGPGGPDFHADTEAQLATNLRDIHDGLDIVSIHFYNGGDQARFGVTGRYDAGLLEHVKRMTDAIGKPLFVGELGDSDPTIHDDPASLFATDALRKIASLGIPYCAPWIFEFYQFDTLNADAYDLEPGLTDDLLGELVLTNLALGGPALSRSAPDTVAPEVVLTWPFDGATLDARQTVQVVASDEGRAVARVDLLVDGRVAATSARAPFRFDLDTTGLAPGAHVLAARAVDGAGNESTFAVDVTKP